MNNSLTSFHIPENLIWLIKIAVIAGFALLLALIINKILLYAKQRVKNTATIWDDIIFTAARTPAFLLIAILSSILIINIIADNFALNIGDTAYVLKNIGLIFTLSWFVWRIFDGYEMHIIKSKDVSKADPTTIAAIMKLVKISIFVIASLMALQSFGLSIAGIMTFGGIGGIALGFAAKDMLANFFGTLMIYFDRPFTIGDWIRSPDRQLEGVVEHIGWRLTHIRTFDKRMLYVPNSIFSNIIVENPTQMTNRHITETIGVRYKDIDKIPTILNEIKEMLTKNEGIDSTQGIAVNLSKFEKYSVNFFIDAYTVTKKWAEFNEIKQDILLKINQIISKNGAEIARDYFLDIGSLRSLNTGGAHNLTTTQQPT